MKPNFQFLLDRAWARLVRSAKGWGIDHSPWSHHRSMANARAWRLYNRINGTRLTMAQAIAG